MSEDDSLAVITSAMDLGMRYLDTADAYGSGKVESLIGKAIVGRRRDVTIATKVGLVDGGARGVSNDRDYLRAAVEASLSRLGTDNIDLLYLHRIDPTVSIEKTVEVLGGLVQDGLVGSVGLSEVTSGEIRRAISVYPIAAVQSEWSVWSRDVEHHIVPACAAAGIGFVASSPLGRGFLAGRTAAPPAGDHRNRVPRLSKDHREQNLAVAGELAQIAHKEGITRAQLALVWLRHAGKRAGVNLLAIPGAHSTTQLQENASSAAQIATMDSLDALDRLAERASGHRGNVQWLSLGRE